MSKQRVYIAIMTFHPQVGGAEKQALAQGRILRQRGHQATVITLRHKKEWKARDIVQGVPVIRVGGPLLDGREQRHRVIQQLLFLLALLVMGWTLWLHRRRYDLLHVYQLSSLAIPTGLASRFSGKPMLISVRSTGSGRKRESRSRDSATLIAGPLDPNTPWLQINGLSWIDGDLESVIRLGKPVVNFTRSLLLKINARIIILSTRMRSYLAENNFDLPTTQLIPNGVDTTRFYPREGSISSERSRTVVCISKLRYEKGIDVLLQAWYLVQKQMPDARLIIVGIGPMQQQLTSMAEALKITHSVEFTGLQSDIPSQLHRGGIAVLSSRWEGMPNAVLEAMACGIPCVATRVSGSEDIIQHGENGLLADVEDYRAIAQAMLTLLRDPDLAQKIGQAALATVQEKYTLTHITDTYIELYNDMVGLKTSHEETVPPPEMSQLPS